MPPRKSPPEPRARSGYATEAQRHTSRVVLRLSPLAAQAIREGAEREGMTVSSYIERLALGAIPDAE
jgi:hypothetical protein